MGVDSMPGPLDNSQIPIKCDQCGKVTKKPIRWIRTNSEFSCPCGRKIRINASQFRREMAKVDKSIANLEKALKKFGK
jgi:hypothetical protein